MRAKIKMGKRSTAVGDVAGKTVSDLFHLFDQLREFPEFRSDIPRLAAIDSLCAELQKPNANSGVIKYYWSAIRAATITSSAIDILKKISTKLHLDDDQ
jgi:hypothetical protein